MAPEQYAGRATSQSDVYAAGVVMWEALTGNALFGGATETETIERALSVEVAPPSSRGAGSRELDAVVLRALARDVETRFASAAAFREALEARAPMAPPSGVGAWVERIAHAELDERAAQIEAIERGEATSNAKPRRWLPWALLALAAAGIVLLARPARAPASAAPAPPSPSAAEPAELPPDPIGSASPLPDDPPRSAAPPRRGRPRKASPG